MKIEHKITLKITLLSVICGLLIWIIDSLLHYFASHADSFWGLLILNLSPEEFYHRLIILVCFIISGIFFSKFFVARKKAEKALRQSEKNYRIVVENANEAIIVAQEGKIPFANKKIMEITGYAEEELRSRSFIDLIHPDDRDMVGANYLRRQRGEEVPPVYSLRALDKNGNLKWAEVKEIPFPWKGHPAILYFLKDITDYKLTEELLQKRLAIEKIVSEISSRFINLPAGDIASHIQHALQTIGQFASVDRAFVSLFSANKTTVDKIYEWHAQGTQSKSDRFMEGSLQPFQWSINQCHCFETVYIPRVADLPPEANTAKEIWQAEGIQSILAIPLVLNESVIGFFGFHSERAEKFWREDDINLFKMVAELFANVILRQRGEEALQKIQESFQWLAQENFTIAEIGQILSSTLDIEEVYGSFAEEVRHMIPFDRLAITTINSETDTFTLSYVAGPQLEERRLGDIIPLAGTGLEEVLKTRSSLLIGKKNREMVIRRCPGLLSTFRAGYQSCMLIPLISKNEVIGGLNFQSTQPDAYTEADMKLAERVGAQIAGAIANAQLYAKQKQGEEALRSSEERYRLLVENAPLGILSIDTQGQIIDVNPELSTMFGSPSKQATQSINMLTFPPLMKAGIADHFRCCLETGEGGSFETPYTTKWNKEVYLRYHLTPIRNKDAQISGVQAIMENISDKKKLESQLTQSQKMEAIGTLAGGIAHDFNNILSAIMGYTELAVLGVPENPPAKQNLQEVLKASHRAKDLVRQILTFSRQGEQERKPVLISPIVKETLKLLRASLPSTIEVRQNMESETGIIEANLTQIHQVVMNLCTNAAHAMKENGGVLEVSLANAEMDIDTTAQHPDIHPGPYLRLTVSDTGVGIAPDLLERIFDPYFTTKKVGEGTGLGLAVVHGIVKSHGGIVKVYSEPGKGSTFHIYFPRIDGFQEITETQKDELLPVGGHERVLLVDDEQALVDLGKKMLEHLGYEVAVRTSSVEALELFRNRPDRFDLVIMDFTMPNMTGDKLAQEMMRLRPGLPVILCTGFSERISEMKAKALGIQDFVMKPFDLNDLARTIRRALDHNIKRILTRNLQFL
ncbi:MAG: PAS domain S-box protein [Deltaproteobacteria bacterium]|nr:PAS domain S-box protein [Deltaproteobacteria bacterium]